MLTGGSDPVADGLVARLSHPGGNVTGVLNFASELTAKRFELLRELVPAAAAIAVLRNPENPEAKAQLRDIEAAVREMRLEVRIANASSEREIELNLAALSRQRTDALFIASDTLFAVHRSRIVGLVESYRMPAIYPQRQYVLAGGLSSYGTDFRGVYRQIGVYAGRILNGEKPADLPVMQPTGSNW